VEDANGEWRRLLRNSIMCTDHLARAGHVARMEEGSSAFNILTSKPAGKIPLGRP
jgi:hypothetical protein